MHVILVNRREIQPSAGLENGKNVTGWMFYGLLTCNVYRL